ncbi:MAG: PLDc N-terminal domain-containing protein, partial [Candidatus Nanopelagicaceae bacterium]
MIFSIIDCSRTAENNIRSLPKWAWLVIIIFVPAIGS